MTMFPDAEHDDAHLADNHRGQRAAGYESSLDDNRRTTQQVLVPRRSGIHAVMQRGPRLALITGAVLALLLLLFTVLTTADPATDTSTDPLIPLPTLTAAAPLAYERTVVVAGTGASGLYLRAAAGRDAAIVATIPEGSRLGVTGNSVPNDGLWLPVVTTDGQVGWVAADYTREE
ncbi:MAG: Bacterial domain [Chloroflexota bacterium]|jgi:hypothetical protein